WPPYLKPRRRQLEKVNISCCYSCFLAKLHLRLRNSRFAVASLQAYFAILIIQTKPARLRPAMRRASSCRVSVCLRESPRTAVLRRRRERHRPFHGLLVRHATADATA